MVIGLSLNAFTNLHVLISLIGIVTGAIVLAQIFRGAWPERINQAFLVSTILTSVTGFMFPFAKVLPSHIVGGISLAILAVALLALYARHLAGAWRAVYIVLSVIALYLNVFVLVVQGFLKVGFLHDLAPTQKEPPFAIAQGIVLIAFVAIGRLALKRFHPPASAGRTSGAL